MNKADNKDKFSDLPEQVLIKQNIYKIYYTKYRLWKIFKA